MKEKNNSSLFEELFQPLELDSSSPSSSNNKLRIIDENGVEVILEDDGFIKRSNK